MAGEDLTLELLVRDGSLKKATAYLEDKELPEEEKARRITEAGIYWRIKAYEENGHLEAYYEVPHFNLQPYVNYFSENPDIDILRRLVGALAIATYVDMEAYAQIEPLQILGLDHISDAVQKHRDDDELKEHITHLVRRGYELIFYPRYIEAEHVRETFPELIKWADLVDTDKVVADSIAGFKETDEMLDGSHAQEFVYIALEKMKELTSRERVSDLVFEHFGSEEEYAKLVAAGVIDKRETLEVDKPEVRLGLEKAVEVYGRRGYPSMHALRGITEIAGPDDGEYISLKMVEWLVAGKREHVLGLIAQENKLYDEGIAREAFAGAIASAVVERNYRLLESALRLPEELIDKEEPLIADFVEAYEFFHSQVAN